MSILENSFCFKSKKISYKNSNAFNLLLDKLNFIKIN